jgi:quercetin dioxygenase-like cupin family protein
MPTCKYADLPVASPDPSLSRRQVHTEHLMLVIVDFNDPSATVPLHQHPHEQISYVAEGRIHFVLGEGEDRTVDLLEPGDAVVVPPDVPHTVEVLTQTARVVDCFYPIREDFL